MIRHMALLALAPLMFGQSIEGPVFEVASLKRIGASSRVMQPLTGGPGTDSLTRVTMIAPLGALLTAAFDLRPAQIAVEAKSPALNEFYELNAIVPEGATKADLRAMYRNLLMERFHMRFHTETREMKRYEMVVADGGHKLKAPVREPAKSPPGRAIGAAGPDGYPTIPAGMSVGAVGYRSKWILQRLNITMDEFTRDVESQVGNLVVNQTGLTGKFDMLLRWENPAPTAAPTPDGIPVLTDPPFLPSLRAQLGLSLREGKGPAEVVVIDALDNEAAPN